MQLQDFLGDYSGGSTVQVTKTISWSDECNEDSYSAPSKIVTVALPTAPRSTRVLDDSTIPQNPPFLAYLTNLPYDLNDQDLQEFFEDNVECEIVSVRLPREEGENGRMRGFGYIEFREREQLIAALSLPDPQLRNRKIRIDVSTEQDQRRAGRGHFGGSSDNRDSNWRRGDGNRQDGDGEFRRGGGFGYNQRQRDSSSDNGNWRDRPKQDSPPPMRRNNDRNIDRSNDRINERYGGRRSGYEDRPRRDPAPSLEDRPRLHLTPRTLPLPEIKPLPEPEKELVVERPKPKPVPAASIFGAAKPVDTAAKDREIEERLERERERERLAKQKEEEERQAEEIDADAEAEVKTDDVEEEPHKEPEPTSIDEETTNGKVEVQKEEIISWRRRSDENTDSSRPLSPPRRRFSPDRRPRRNDDRREPPRQDNRRDYHNNRDKRDYRDR